MTRATRNAAELMPAEPIIDADAFNAFEVAGWERQAATYNSFIGPHQSTRRPVVARRGRGTRYATARRRDRA